MIVVADTSVLVNLARVGKIQLLQHLFREVIVPLEVADEFKHLAQHSPRFRGLVLPSWIRQQAVEGIPERFLSFQLDLGETAALALALHIKADLILVDERRGYQVAVQLGLNTIGILGVLLQAKFAGLVPEVRPILDDLQHTAGFWIHPVLRAGILKTAGEHES